MIDKYCLHFILLVNKYEKKRREINFKYSPCRRSLHSQPIHYWGLRPIDFR